MLLEVGGTILTYYTTKQVIKYMHDKDSRRLKFIFNDIMLKSSIKNKSDETYKIYKVTKMKYGYFTLIQIPNGLDFAKLESLKELLQDDMKCLIEFEKDRYSNLVKCKFIYYPQDNKDFTPVKTKSHELFLGYTLDGKPYKINLNKDPHILISGKTGTGKSFLFASILTNLIYNNSKDIELYLFQIMKGEIDVFKNCKPVKFISNDNKEILIMLQKLHNKINERSKKFAKYGIKNITRWNKHFCKQKMKRIIIGVEEISFFMNRSHKNDKDRENDPYFKYFTGIVKAGRSVGIHFICLTQRTTAKNLGGDGELKSQMCVITGQQKTKQDSINAIDIPDASNLKIQEYIADSNDGYVWFKAPNIDEDYNILQQYVQEIIVPSNIIKQNKKQNKQNIILKQNQSNELICTKSEWISLEQYNKEKQVKILNKVNPHINKYKGIISLNNLKDSDNNVNQNR